MASQIEQLRASFDKMSTAQKRQFITNLKQKLQGSTNAEYTKFLNECVQKYDTEMRKGSKDVIDLLETTDKQNHDKYRLYSFYIALLTTPFLLVFRMMAQVNEKLYNTWRTYDYYKYVPRNIQVAMFVILAVLTVISFMLRKNSKNPDKSKDIISLVLNIINIVLGIIIITLELDTGSFLYGFF